MNLSNLGAARLCPSFERRTKLVPVAMASSAAVDNEQLTRREAAGSAEQDEE